MGIVISGNKNLKFIKSVYYQPVVPPLFPIRLYTTKVNDSNYIIYNDDTVRLLDYFESNKFYDGTGVEDYYTVNLEPGQLYINDVEILYISGVSYENYYKDCCYQAFDSLPGMGDYTEWYIVDTPEYKRGTLRFHIDE